MLAIYVHRTLIIICYYDDVFKIRSTYNGLIKEIGTEKSLVSPPNKHNHYCGIIL